MESKVFTSQNQGILWSYWNASAQATYNNYDEFHNYYVSIYEIKEMAVLLDNFTDLTLDIELYVKSASNCYGTPPYPRAGNDYAHTDYVWDGVNPSSPQPDGLFHKIPWASGTIAPGESLFKKQEGSTFIPPAISAPAPPPEGGNSYAEIKYGSGATSISLQGLAYWIVTPHFKHLAE